MRHRIQRAWISVFLPAIAVALHGGCAAVVEPGAEEEPWAEAAEPVVSCRHYESGNLHAQGTCADRKATAEAVCQSFCPQPTGCGFARMTWFCAQTSTDPDYIDWAYGCVCEPEPAGEIVPLCENPPGREYMASGRVSGVCPEGGEGESAELDAECLAYCQAADPTCHGRIDKECHTLAFPEDGYYFEGWCKCF